MAYEVEDAIGDAYWIKKHYGKDAPIQIQQAMDAVLNYLERLKERSK